MKSTPQGPEANRAALEDGLSKERLLAALSVSLVFQVTAILVAIQGLAVLSLMMTIPASKAPSSGESSEEPVAPRPDDTAQSRTWLGPFRLASSGVRSLGVSSTEAEPEVIVAPLYAEARIEVVVCPWDIEVPKPVATPNEGSLPDPGKYCGWNIHNQRMLCEC